MVKIHRRTLNWGLLGGVLTAFFPRESCAEKRPRADKVLWGGLGYSVANLDIQKRFPFISKAIEQISFSKLVGNFTNRLAMSYPGGVVEDDNWFDGGSDPMLLFVVSLDYEQVIMVPNDGGAGDFQLSFVYALSQVFYLDFSASGSAGDLRVLYSFPFRVQSGETARPKNASDQVQNVQKLLLQVDNSLVNVFSKRVATKKFREGIIPKRLKVRSVNLTPESTALFSSLGIDGVMDKEFFGQAFTASLAEQGDLSVLPFFQNDTISALGNRFKNAPRIHGIFERYSQDDQNDFVVDLTVFRSLRQSNGGNVANVLYARGLSVFVKVTNLSRNQVVFEKKILLIENNELPRAMFDRLKDYDLRYMVQIAIKLFDNFVRGVMKDDSAAIKMVGLDPAKDMVDVKALRDTLKVCQYPSG